MISITLMGRSGNCIFQIATLYSWAKRTGFAPYYPNWTDAKYFEGNFTNNDEFTPNFVYHEPFFHYNPLPAVDNCLAQGYFQSELYFKEYRDDILKLFKIREEYIRPSIKLLDYANLASIHVRRTDYLNLPNHHPVLDLNYYSNAIRYYSCDTQFIICSDDIDWCKKTFGLRQFQYSDGNMIEDLYIMSHCNRGNIIANSSFSWWGAWLNQSCIKKVVAPRLWFGPALAQHCTKDIYCHKWNIL